MFGCISHKRVLIYSFLSLFMFLHIFFECCASADGFLGDVTRTFLEWDAECGEQQTGISCCCG